MFTTPAPAPSQSGLSTSLASASAASSPSALSPTPPTSSRPSRLRGLSYLRNNFQTHLLSRESSNGNSNNTSSQNPSSTSSRLTRSISYTPASPASPTSPTSPTATTTTTTTTINQSQNPSTASHRFTLISPLSHPLRSLGPSDNDTPTQLLSPTNAIPSTGTALDDLLGNISTEEPAGRRSMTRTRSATTGSVMATTTTDAANGNSNLDILPSIRFSTFYDPRATRPSLTFSPVSRTLPTGGEIIRVGRYSERDSQPPIPNNVPSAAPVGFKSKVVSRRHCEFWYEGGKWYIKDVKSSSGTFLNHIRLSPPGTESKPFPINDGDIVQLGIDFKGGEEMIFRCVKMRLELNRGWQNKLNTFNMTTHKRLRNMTNRNEKNNDSSAQNNYSQDCSICLNSIAPCQCLFVAPCSHTWHYKCIRSLLSSPQYPIFICPNCRAAADLEAEVDDPEDWEQLDSDDPEKDESADKADGGGSSANKKLKDSESATPSAAPSVRKSTDRARRSAERSRVSMDRGERERERARASMERKLSAPEVPVVPVALLPPPGPIRRRATDDADVTFLDGLDTISQGQADQMAIDTGMSTPSSTGSEHRGDMSHATSEPIGIPAAAPIQRRTPSPTTHLNGHEGPITPRNDAGPWVFDGSGLRRGETAVPGSAPVQPGHMESLDSLTEMDTA